MSICISKERYRNSDTIDAESRTIKSCEVDECMAGKAYLQAASCANIEWRSPWTPFTVADKRAKRATMTVAVIIPNFRPTLSLMYPMLLIE